MSDPHSVTAVVHDLAAQRFETTVDGAMSHADYQRVGNTLHLVHTEVPPALRGHGIAAALVGAALDYATANELRVNPLCSYVRAYMRRHPETQTLLASGARF
jgi:predicted GNAT family acetyltransferase